MYIADYFFAWWFLFVFFIIGWVIFSLIKDVIFSMKMKKEQKKIASIIEEVYRRR